jgi:hypothetical protein
MKMSNSAYKSVHFKDINLLICKKILINSFTIFSTIGEEDLSENHGDGISYILVAADNYYHEIPALINHLWYNTDSSSWVSIARNRYE